MFCEIRSVLTNWVHCEENEVHDILQKAVRILQLYKNLCNNWSSTKQFQKKKKQMQTNKNMAMQS